MRQQVKNDGYEFAAKLNAISVDKEGWYVCKVNLPSSLVGVKSSDLRIYCAESSDFTVSSVILPSTFEVVNLTAKIFDGKFFGLEDKDSFLLAALLPAGKSFIYYFAKILLALLFGGCNVGFGVIGVSVGSFLIWRLYKRHS